MRLASLSERLLALCSLTVMMAWMTPGTQNRRVRPAVEEGREWPTGDEDRDGG